MTTEELPPFGQIHQSSFAGHASASKRIPAHKHPHKSFVITRVATVKALHQVWYGLLMLAREVQGDRKWDLGEYINPHRSAKYSSNFTPEWIKTWPFIFFCWWQGKTSRLQFSHQVWDICSPSFKCVRSSRGRHYIYSIAVIYSVIQLAFRIICLPEKLSGVWMSKFKAIACF